ncbi:MAG: hypothetical protein JNJ93_01250 [Acinetobacter sp.]|nr:hypothetical protein [Acinetobacter sp.]
MNRNKLHQHSSLRPSSRRKRLMRKWYLMHTTRRRVWQLHNPLEPLPAEDQIQPIRWQEHLLP